MNFFNNAKKSMKGYLPVLQNEPDDDDDDPELGPSATNLEEPSLMGGCCDLTYKQRITGFFMSAGTGLLFLFLSSFFVAGLLIGSVAKFAMCYFFANIFLLLSTTFLVGIREQCKHMFEKKRFPLTIIYIGTLTLAMASVFSHQSIFIAVPLIVVQFIALIMYIVSYMPGGVSFINFCGSKMGRLIFRFS
eukprot:CAMPEP_0202689868 /NCGR_PEP_ID=MMETSP1385-20130828/5047_1 /ASSEMBLY_ACC=CAM_ASM_000861 /TAXON_ID=933848 /ORGANISM="Elphidium margaritaceum" /LENGTH=189 /DNA_ID=CAMNT_0049345077 /DNA_START=47 /DNA_END=616 /DNA_ORIENTATION=+